MGGGGVGAKSGRYKVNDSGGRYSKDAAMRDSKCVCVCVCVCMCVFVCVSTQT